MSGHKCDGCRYKGEHQEMGFKPFGVCFKETNLIKAEENYKAETCPYKFALPQLYETEEIETEPAEEWPKENPHIIKPLPLPALPDNLLGLTPEAHAELEAKYAEVIKARAELVDLLLPIVKNIVKTLTPIVESFVNHLFPICKELCEVFTKAIDLYPNARVKHLAIHGKNKRIRKKNINRILKYFERETKNAP